MPHNLMYLNGGQNETILPELLTNDYKLHSWSNRQGTYLVYIKVMMEVGVGVGYLKESHAR